MLLVEAFDHVPSASIRGKRQYGDSGPLKFGVEPVEGRHFPNAGRAPSSPEVEHQPLAAIVGKTPFLTVSVDKTNLREVPWGTRELKGRERAIGRHALSALGARMVEGEPPGGGQHGSGKNREKD